MEWGGKNPTPCPGLIFALELSSSRTSSCRVLVLRSFEGVYFWTCGLSRPSIATTKSKVTTPTRKIPALAAAVACICRFILDPLTLSPPAPLVLLWLAPEEMSRVTEDDSIAAFLRTMIVVQFQGLCTLTVNRNEANHSQSAVVEELQRLMILFVINSKIRKFDVTVRSLLSLSLWFYSKTTDCVLIFDTFELEEGGDAIISNLRVVPSSMAIRRVRPQGQNMSWK